MPREVYEIKIDRPEDVSVAELRDYILEAVRIYGGEFSPDHPLFHCRFRNRVKYVKRQRPAKT